MNYARCGEGVTDKGKGGLRVVEGGKAVGEGFDFLCGFDEEGGDGAGGAEGEA